MSTPAAPSFRFTPISPQIADVLVIEPRVIADRRGFLMEVWQRERFSAAGIDFEFVQENHSRSIGGVLRGLHYQLQRPQGKLVRVVAGEVFDVAVDLRRDSPSFGRWAGVTLSAENHRMLWLPPGFAHGFLVLSETAELSYSCTEFYVPGLERGIRWDDPQLAIDWPLAAGQQPILSDRDARGVWLRDAELDP